MSDKKCRDCGAPMYEAFQGIEHTTGGIDCLSRQNAALQARVVELEADQERRKLACADMALRCDRIMSGLDMLQAQMDGMHADNASLREAKERAEAGCAAKDTQFAEIEVAIRRCFKDRTMPFAEFSFIALGWRDAWFDNAASPGAAILDRLSKAEAALQALYDVQNGPPLIRDTDEWDEAMKLASEVFAAAEASQKGATNG